MVVKYVDQHDVLHSTVYNTPPLRTEAYWVTLHNILFPAPVLSGPTLSVLWNPSSKLAPGPI